jgi:hypothetical protein
MNTQEKQMQVHLIFEKHEQREALMAMFAQDMLTALRDIDNAARNCLKHGGDPEQALQHIRTLVHESMGFLD